MKLITFKKAALAAGLFFGYTMTGFAQGPYAKLGLGYQFATGAITMEQRVGSQMERVKLGYGKGVTANAGIGYMFNQNIGAELGLGYLVGGKTEIKSVYNNRVEDDIFYARMFLIQPSLIISAGREGLNPYGKFGLIAAKGKLVHELEYSQNGVVEMEWHETGGWGLGLQAALGLEVGLNEQLAFYTELSMNNLRYAPERAEAVMYRNNGADHLGLLEVRAREIEYVDDYPTNQGSPPSLPSKELRRNQPLSSLGINVGVKFNF